jgi:hypothetical protein
VRDGTKNLLNTVAYPRGSYTGFCTPKKGSIDGVDDTMMGLYQLLSRIWSPPSPVAITYTTLFLVLFEIASYSTETLPTPQK